jgi:hypothetical protein
MVDDRGHPLDADYYGEPDGPYIALILKSRSGSGQNPPQPTRNRDYNPALGLLLARLGELGAVLVDVLLDTDYVTQRLGMPEADRRLIKSPIQLALEPDMALLRRRIGNAAAKIGRTSETSRGGETRKKIRLRVDVPNYQPDGAARLAERLAARITETAETELRYSPVDEAEEAVQDAAGKVVRRGAGQGFQRNQEVKAKVEERAMKMATQFYDGKGWTVRDVHRTESYDLLCLRNGEVKHVEVKGTTEDGAMVLLTRNEVRHARENPSTALFVLSNVRVEPAEDGTIHATGGVRHLNDPWHVDDGTLTPLGFRYQVPAQRAKDS